MLFALQHGIYFDRCAVDVGKHGNAVSKFVIADFPPLKYVIRRYVVFDSFVAGQRYVLFVCHRAAGHNKLVGSRCIVNILNAIRDFLYNSRYGNRFFAYLYGISARVFRHCTGAVVVGNGDCGYLVTAFCRYVKIKRTAFFGDIFHIEMHVIYRRMIHFDVAYRKFYLYIADNVAAVKRINTVFFGRCYCVFAYYDRNRNGYLARLFYDKGVILAVCSRSIALCKLHRRARFVVVRNGICICRPLGV